MSDIHKSKSTPKTVELQNTVQKVMEDLVADYSDRAEFKTIMMNLTTVSKELNAIRIKEIYSEPEKAVSNV